MTRRSRATNAAALAAAAVLLLPALAFAQAGGGGDPFSSGVQWFVSGPARGVAMLSVAAAAVLVWFLMGSLRLAGFVLGGGLILANVQTIVGWMGF
jgi:type IV secretory pathway VirB2 component (pilin)